MNKFTGCLVLSAFATLAGLSETARANETQVNYRLAAHEISHPIAVPGANTPMSLTCAQTMPNPGVGQATLLRGNALNSLFWVGMDLATGAISSNASGTANTHIIWCDQAGSVAIEVYDSLHIQVNNYSSVTADGVINFVW
jgi:hypothetical protein